MRRTKIICTLGPASNTYEVIRDLVKAGMDVARLNFSHGTYEEHARVIAAVRRAAEEVGRTVAIMQDLQGPKIRLGEIRGGGVLVHKGDRLILTTEPIVGDEHRVYVSYPALPQEVKPGNRILIDDGHIELVVLEVRDKEVITEVVVGGPLRSKKGVNLPHIQASAPPLTEKDIRDLEFGLSQGVDWIALSFVRSEKDVAALLERIKQAGKQVGVIAKIEKPEAVQDIDRILERADGVMVARGDLGIEMPLAEVPVAQKMIIRKALVAARPVITATQMLESMIENPRPTRAEVSDVANAVLDGSDAVMLSGETAMGKYPVRVVEVMNEIIMEAEKHRKELTCTPHILPHERTKAVTEAISYTAFQLADQVQAVAIVCLTHSGATARHIARHRPDVPVYAFTDDPAIVKRLALLWGTQTFSIPFQRDTDAGVRMVHEVLLEKQLVKEGERIVVTVGMPLPAMGRTNTVHVSTVKRF